MTFLWAAKSPWEKFSRATFMPASIICFMTAGDSEAGPMVQTILVLLIGSFKSFLRGYLIEWATESPKSATQKLMFQLSTLDITLAGCGCEVNSQNY